MAEVTPFTNHIDILYSNINRIGESVDKIESTVSKENCLCYLYFIIQ